MPEDHVFGVDFEPPWFGRTPHMVPWYGSLPNGSFNALKRVQRPPGPHYVYEWCPSCLVQSGETVVINQYDESKPQDRDRFIAGLNHCPDCGQVPAASARIIKTIRKGGSARTAWAWDSNCQRVQSMQYVYCNMTGCSHELEVISSAPQGLIHDE